MRQKNRAQQILHPTSKGAQARSPDKIQNNKTGSTKNICTIRKRRTNTRTGKPEDFIFAISTSEKQTQQTQSVPQIKTNSPQSEIHRGFEKC